MKMAPLFWVIGGVIVAVLLLTFLSLGG